MRNTSQKVSGQGHLAFAYQSAVVVAAVCVLEGVGLVERHGTLIDVHVVQFNVNAHRASELESSAELILAKEGNRVGYHPVTRQNSLLIALEPRSKPLTVPRLRSVVMATCRDLDFVKRGLETYFSLGA